MDEQLGYIRNTPSQVFNEIVAYEMLWAERNMTQSKVIKLFAGDVLPSEAIAQAALENDFFHDSLRHRIEEYVRPRLEEVEINLNDNLQYPETLRNDSPFKFLYYRGDINLMDTKAIAISGSRNASKEGISRATKVAKELVEEGYTIVSGLAKGIDTAAHKYSIENQGKTIGVLGTPIDCHYPKENKELQDRIARDHLLVSHVPFYRYDQDPFPAKSHYFPQRNKLIASLSAGVVIIEAASRSGSVIQAKEALKQNKKLFILTSCLEAKDNDWARDLVASGKATEVNKTEDITGNL